MQRCESHATTIQLQTTETQCWGWLEPSSVLLPCVLLTGNGVAVGRGKEAFQERVLVSEQASSWSNQLLVGRNKNSNHCNGLDFVEVADGRVSRMHCIVLSRKTGQMSEAILEDCSSNGTFVNNRKLGKGESVVLNDKDKISLVMSVAPMAEQYFIFHKGHPRDQDMEKFGPRGEGVAAQRYGGQVSRCRSSLSKWPTCKYTTADRCTLEDFECQICLSTLSSCVTIEPCGHSFCAVCLSNYVSNQLENGAQLTCPLRCPEPERFIKNETVRNLIDKKKRETRHDDLLTTEEEVDHLIDNELQMMSPRCPLHDEQLPLEVKHLKTRQVDLTLQRLKTPDLDVDEKNHCLELIARLCWSDDEARKDVADASGIALIKKTMEGTLENEAVQCNSCLALMALVRGEGSVCQLNQWEIARSGIVEVIGKAMRTYRSNSMVQLSAMLCFIPLALDNPVMQALLTQTVLPDILTALDIHGTECDVQCKGLIVLGILAQGEDGLHDAICNRQVEAGMTKRIVAALKNFGSSNEEVFWGALFALATLANESRNRFSAVCRSLSGSGVLRLLKEVLNTYQDRIRHSNQNADETIMAAGNYLIAVISAANRRRKQEWQTVLLGGVGLSLLVGSICVFVTFKKRSS